MNSRESPPLSPPFATLRLDRVEFRASFYSPDEAPYREIPLPDGLAWLFESKALKITKAGFVTPKAKRGYLATNGVRLVRNELGLPEPTDEESRNQFSLKELTSEAGTLGSEDQIELFLEALGRFYSFVHRNINGDLKIQMPLRFQYGEFYQELPLPTYPKEFFESCFQIVAKEFGSEMRSGYDLRFVSERETQKSKFDYYWRVPHKIKKYKNQEVRLKLYEKADRLRVEVSFRGFFAGSSLSWLHNFGEVDVGEEVYLLLYDLREAADDILSRIVPMLNGRVALHPDVSLIRKKLKEYGVRSPKGISYAHLTDSLCTKGMYDPATFPVDERPSSEMLRRLSGPNGFLEKRSELNRSGNPKRNFYLLRKDWEDTHPAPKT